MHTTKPPKLLAFTDVESTGLDPFFHDAWEVAVILRHDGQDEEHVVRIEPDLTNADPEALRVNRYEERTSAPDWVWDDRETGSRRLYELLDGAVLIGSNPAFDAEMIGNLLARYFNERPWHYRTIDVVTLATGALYGRAAEWAAHGDATWFDRVTRAVGWPWKSYDVSRHVEVEPPAPHEAHTALPDARWVRDLWDRITVPDASLAASDEQLAAMTGGALHRLNGGQL